MNTLKNSVINNPYRILGTFSNVSTRELLSNKSKLSRFLAVGRDIEFETDFSSFLLVPANRTVKSVEESYAMLNLDDDKLRSALRWFVCLTEVDKEAFSLLRGGDAKSAKKLWLQSDSWSSLQNIIIVDIILDEILEAAKCATQLYEKHLCDIKTCLSLNTSLDKNSIIQDFFNDVLSTGYSHQALLNACTSESVRAFFQDKFHNDTYADLKNKISAVTKREIRLRPKLIKEIIEVCKNRENEFKNKRNDIVQESHWQDIGNLFLQCCIKTVNDYQDTIIRADKDTIKGFKYVGTEIMSILKTLHEMNFSDDISKKLQENISILGELMKNVKERVQLNVALNEDICWFCGEPSTHKVVRSYKNYESWTSGNTKYTRTYTRDVKINICELCQNELDEKHQWHVIGFFVALFAEMCVMFIITCDVYGVFEFNFHWLWVTLFGNLLIWPLTMALGKLLGKTLRLIFRFKHIRRFKQKESDHPAVKAAEQEGYNREGTILDRLFRSFN